MKLYSKIQEKIIFTEKANMPFFHYEVNTNITSNYEIYERAYVFKGNISKTFANNTFANIIFSTDPSLIDDTITYHIDKICNNNLKFEKETLLRMREAIYDAIEMPLPINIINYILNLNRKYKSQLTEFERVIDKRLNNIDKNSLTQNIKENFNLIEGKLNNLPQVFNSSIEQFIDEFESKNQDCVLPEVCSSERHSAKDFNNLNIDIQEKIINCHEIDFYLSAFNLKIGKTRIESRIHIAQKLGLDITNKIILIEVIDRGGYFKAFLTPKKLEQFNSFNEFDDFRKK